MDSRALPFLLLACLVAYATCEEVVYEANRFVVVGSNFTIKCILPDGYQLKWTKNLQKLDGPEYVQRVEVKAAGHHQISYLTVYNVNPNHTGHYRCYTFDLDRYQYISVVFDTAAAASATEEQKASPWVLDVGHPKSITCNVSYDLTINLTWFKNGMPLNVSLPKYQYTKENNTLVITKAVDDDAGVYMCAIEGDLSRNQTVTLKTRAKVEKFAKSLNMVQGDKLKLNCTVYGYPVPIITWFKNGNSLNLTDRIKLSPDSRNVSDAILVIDHLEDDDRAEYRCQVTNEVNSVNTTIMIRVKDKLAALWPFLGILAEVAVLCTIIFIYEKRRAKQEYDESDTDQNNENKPVSDQKEKDVRQRK